MDRRLKDLPSGASGVVTGFVKSEQNYRDKLLAMGLTKGTPFTVIRVAPLGDPVEIQVRGFKLSLRKSEADIILVDTPNCSTGTCDGCSSKGGCRV